MRIERTINGLRSGLAVLRASARGEVGLVPTMGALHAGHLSLIAAARAECRIVVASVFVNPAQFGADEDLGRYPRNEEEDARIAEASGVDVLFVPTAEEMYPPRYETWVEVEQLGAVLEGAVRPGHFRGVATVCLKLFNLVAPDRVYFGRKDAQQAEVVRRMLIDLNLPIRLRVLPTVRDADGLALSSRNVYLGEVERRQALALPRALAAGREAWRRGADPIAAAQRLLAGVAVDYLVVVDLDVPTLAAAIDVAGTRLIDNVSLIAEETETP